MVLLLLGSVKVLPFPPAESPETWNHISVLNGKVRLSGDRGDEGSSLNV